MHTYTRSSVAIVVQVAFDRSIGTERWGSASINTMYSKNSLPYDPQDVPPSRRFRLNVADLFLSNLVSAERAQSLVEDAAAAGAQGMSDLQETGDSRHVHRNLTRRLLKTSRWSALYEARVQTWNPRTGAEDETLLPFALPHDIIN